MMPRVHLPLWKDKEKQSSRLSLEREQLDERLQSTRPQPVRLLLAHALIDKLAHPKSSRASSHSCRTRVPAGSAWASAADWPAQACMRCTSPALPAASRIGAVSPRCTGYGAGEGASEVSEAKT